MSDNNNSNVKSLTEEQAKSLTGKLDDLVHRMRSGKIQLMDLVKEYEQHRVKVLPDAPEDRGFFVMAKKEEK